MNKSELVGDIAQRTGATKADAQRALDATIEAISAALGRGEDVALPGFGKFSVSARAARTGTNPRTGEKVAIAATTVPRFSAGAQLKAAVAK